MPAMPSEMLRALAARVLVLDAVLEPREISLTPCWGSLIESLMKLYSFLTTVTRDGG